MSFDGRAAASAARLLSHFAASDQITITKPGVSSFGSDLSVTFSPESYTVPCTVPAPFFGAGEPDRIQRGLATVFLARDHPAISFAPERGMIAEFGGEQFRIDRADFLPGSIRLDLAGGSPVGAESA